MINNLFCKSNLMMTGILAGMFFFPSLGKCNQYREASLSQKVDASDTVVIARVVSVYTQGCLKMYSCAHLRIKIVLKGQPTVGMTVLFDGPIAEDDPICCKVGYNYLLFLKKANGIFYVSSDGPFGVYRID